MASGQELSCPLKINRTLTQNIKRLQVVRRVDHWTCRKNILFGNEIVSRWSSDSEWEGDVVRWTPTTCTVQLRPHGRLIHNNRRHLNTPRYNGPRNVRLVEGEGEAEGHVQGRRVIGMAARVAVEGLFVKAATAGLGAERGDAVFGEAALDPREHYLPQHPPRPTHQQLPRIDHPMKIIILRLRLKIGEHFRVGQS